MNNRNTRVQSSRRSRANTPDVLDGNGSDRFTPDRRTPDRRTPDARHTRLSGSPAPKKVIIIISSINRTLIYTITIQTRLKKKLT